MKLYTYVGPDDLLRQSHKRLGFPVRIGAEVRQWLLAEHPEVLGDGTVPATFIVDADGLLRVAHRRSEHVSCAGGSAVRAAGEMFFAADSDKVEVVEVTNQSTGYCPDVSSWSAVADALEAAAIAHPGRFTRSFIFRLCKRCGQRNIVKDGEFRCGVCEADLPRHWNFDAAQAKG